MTQDEFIHWHIRTCIAGPAKKYDNTKSPTAVHSLEYSRRKCAKNIWRRMRRQGQTIGPLPFVGCSRRHMGSAATHELMEELYVCCDTDFDRQIVELRSRGHTVIEVAKKLSSSKATIDARLQAVEAAYLERERARLRSA